MTRTVEFSEDMVVELHTSRLHGQGRATMWVDNGLDELQIDITNPTKLLELIKALEWTLEQIVD